MSDQGNGATLIVRGFSILRMEVMPECQAVQFSNNLTSDHVAGLAVTTRREGRKVG